MTIKRKREIQIDPHTLEKAHERGTNEDEIRDVINTGVPTKARYGRTGKSKIYEFNRKRNNKYFEPSELRSFM